MPSVQMVHISYQGKTVEAKMVDSCPGCGPNDLGGCHIVDTLGSLSSWDSPRQTCPLLHSGHLPP
jgi:hypothetical protein